MENLIKTIKKRHEETLEYYQGEILTEGEKKILRSEMSFLLMILDDAKALPIQRVSSSFTADEVVKELEDCETLDDAIMFFKQNWIE